MGSVLTASPLGLFFGAFLGGRSADLWGRRNALILSIVVFGVFQLATPWAPGYSGLAAIRFLCGVGLGGALPNLIALTAEASGLINRSRRPAFASSLISREERSASWRSS